MLTYRILTGDVRETLKTLPAQSVQTVVTSPPYWGLRDYGTAQWDGGDADCDHKQTVARHDGGRVQVDGFHGSARPDSDKGAMNYRSACGKCGSVRIDAQIGLEPSPEAYVAGLVAVFAEVRRVLRDDGTVWLNLGSSYLGGVPGSGGPSDKQLSNRGSRFVYDGTRPNLSPSRQRARACGTDGTALRDSTGADSACSDLCDGCLSDYLSHRDGIAGSDRQTSQFEPQLSQTGRDTEQTDYALASPGVSPLDVPASTTLESWRRHRGECSRCDSRASSLSGLRSSSGDVPAFARMTWLNYTSKLKQKDLVPIPWMVAMALQADGWYLRSDIIWSKPNPMPESVTDRPTKAHEYIFLLSKSARYYYDADAIAERSVETSGWAKQRAAGENTWAYNDTVERIAQTGQRVEASTLGIAGTRNKRSVWHVATQPYPDAHFATFPETLIEPCILAGSSEKGQCAACGAPWVRVCDDGRLVRVREGSDTSGGTALEAAKGKHGATSIFATGEKRVRDTTSWEPSCACDAGEPIPQTVLDPFCGSGTTGVVAIRHQRHFIGCELNPEYVTLAEKRIGDVSPLFADREVSGSGCLQPSLFLESESA